MRPAVWEILKQEGLDPSPERVSTTWADFLRSQADALLACDFIETITLNGQRQYILAVMEHATRRVRVLGTTAHPSASWISLVMDLEDTSSRDREGKFPALTSDTLAEAGIQTVPTGIRMPRMNSIMERWVQSRRRERFGHTPKRPARRGSPRALTCRLNCMDGLSGRRKHHQLVPQHQDLDLLVAIDPG
ncbi:hypothetical protein ACWEPL_49980 [Nonomuraea sp. NPDC004186]